MTVLVILAHPDPASLNHALARAVVERLTGNGHAVAFHDLYAEGFDPLLPAAEIPRDAPLAPVLAAHCRELAEAGGIVIVHPNWWGMPPAILTGYVDRVFRPGLAYAFVEGDSGEGAPMGLLKARAAVVINTSNTAAEREARVFGDPLERIWRDCVFGLCGLTDVRRVVFETVVTSSPETRRSWIQTARDMVDAAFGRA